MATALANRAIGAIVGSAVADAAAQPLHWVYDLQKLQRILDKDPNPEFRSESANPFYRRQTGQQSCYGDQAFVLLESLSECGDTPIRFEHYKNAAGEFTCFQPKWKKSEEEE